MAPATDEVLNARSSRSATTPIEITRLDVSSQAHSRDKPRWRTGCVRRTSPRRSVAVSATGRLRGVRGSQVRTVLRGSRQDPGRGRDPQ
jgi:hypothetical protein